MQVSPHPRQRLARRYPSHHHYQLRTATKRELGAAPACNADLGGCGCPGVVLQLVGRLAASQFIPSLSPLDYFCFPLMTNNWPSAGGPKVGRMRRVSVCRCIPGGLASTRWADRRPPCFRIGYQANKVVQVTICCGLFSLAAAVRTPPCR